MKFRKICFVAGVCLLLAGVALFLGRQWRIRSAERQTEAYVETLRSLLPQEESAVLETRRDNGMPLLSLEGTDFVGILEMPRYASALPVCAQWGQPSKYPCRFFGSAYDGSLQIGATTQKGQYDFFREISVGDALFFTDMAGDRYAYIVTDIRYEKHVNEETLHRAEGDLTLFVQNVSAMEYVVIYCNAPGGLE